MGAFHQDGAETGHPGEQLGYAVVHWKSWSTLGPYRSNTPGVHQEDKSLSENIWLALLTNQTDPSNLLFNDVTYYVITTLS